VLANRAGFCFSDRPGPATCVGSGDVAVSDAVPYQEWRCRQALFCQTGVDGSCVVRIGSIVPV
jgi:hypothetical protein